MFVYRRFGLGGLLRGRIDGALEVVGILCDRDPRLVLIDAQQIVVGLLPKSLGF